MKKILTLFLLGGFLLSFAQQQQDEIFTAIVEFEGKRFDSLYLVFTFDDEIRGQSNDGYTWEFRYPASLHESTQLVRFRVPGSPDTVRNIVFSLTLDGNTLAGGFFIFGAPESRVTARHIGAQTLPNMPEMCMETREMIRVTFVVDNFEISTDDQELITTIMAHHRGRGFTRHPFSHAGFTDEVLLQRNMEFIKEHPNSQWMMASLYQNLSSFNSNDDIAKVFNLFSQERQQSFFGQKVYRYISPNVVFLNQKLNTWDTDVFEWIVQDSSRYNLILFSASWCPPCTRQIPILKEIYRDLGRDLIMTYVSLDVGQRTVDNWRTKMREHEIPWRSLMVLTRGKARAVRSYHGIRGIPQAILVHPHTMQKERLNLWEEADRQRLYDLVR